MINDGFLWIHLRHTCVYQNEVQNNLRLWNAVLKFQIERIFLQSIHVYTWYSFVAESASKFGYHRYYRKKDESHGYFLHFYRIFEEHDVKNDEYKTCRWNIFWKRHWLCVNSAGNMGRWSKIVHAGSSNAGKMASYIILCLSHTKKKIRHTKLIWTFYSYLKYFVQILYIHGMSCEILLIRPKLENSVRRKVQVLCLWGCNSLESNRSKVNMVIEILWIRVTVTKNIKKSIWATKTLVHWNPCHNMRLFFKMTKDMNVNLAIDKTSDSL